METDTVTQGEWFSADDVYFDRTRLNVNTWAFDDVIGEEVVAIASPGNICGTGTLTPCVYAPNDKICNRRSCRAINNQPSVRYVSKLAYLNAKILSL